MAQTRKPRTRRRGIVARLRRSARRRMSLDYAKELLSTLIWVTPLTLLIWGVAEREQTVAETVAVAVAATSDDVTRVTRVAGPSGEVRQRVRLDLEGPRGGIAAVRQALDPTGSGEIKLPVGETLAPGEHNVDVAAALAELPIFTDAGVSINRSVPAQVRVVIDAKLRRSFPLSASVVEDGGSSGGPASVALATLQAEFDPPQVEAVGPEGVVGRDGLRAVAVLDPRQRPAVGQERVLANVPVRLVDEAGRPVRDPEVVFEPPAVSAVLRRVPAQVREYTVRSMVLRVSKPAAVEGRWRVEPAQAVITNVTLRGPAERIAELERGEVRPEAVLEVPADEEPGIRRTGRLRVNLPAGVDVVGDPPTVDYTVVPVEE